MDPNRMSVMAFASVSEMPNIMPLSLALGATGEWGLCDFEPFHSFERSVMLALAKQPYAILVAHNLGGVAGADLKVRLSQAGYVGAAAMAVSFANTGKVLDMILKSYENNPFRWDDPWQSPSSAADMRNRLVISRPRVTQEWLEEFGRKVYSKAYW